MPLYQKEAIMKRLCLLLAAVFCMWFALAACGNKEPESRLPEVLPDYLYDEAAAYTWQLAEHTPLFFEDEDMQSAVPARFLNAMAYYQRSAFGEHPDWDKIGAYEDEYNWYFPKESTDIYLQKIFGRAGIQTAMDNYRFDREKNAYYLPKEMGVSMYFDAQSVYCQRYDDRIVGSAILYRESDQGYYTVKEGDAEIAFDILKDENGRFYLSYAVSNIIRDNGYDKVPYEPRGDTYENLSDFLEGDRLRLLETYKGYVDLFNVAGGSSGIISLGLDFITRREYGVHIPGRLYVYTVTNTDYDSYMHLLSERFTREKLLQLQNKFFADYNGKLAILDCDGGLMGNLDKPYWQVLIDTEDKLYVEWIIGRSNNGGVVSTGGTYYYLQKDGDKWKFFDFGRTADGREKYFI